MTFTLIPNQYAPLGGELRYVVAADGTGTIDVQFFDDADGSLLGAKRFAGAATASFDAAPCLRRGIRFIPTTGSTGFHTVDGRSVTARIEARSETTPNTTVALKAGIPEKAAVSAKEPTCGVPAAAFPAIGASTAEASIAGTPTAGAMKGGALPDETRTTGKESTVTGMTDMAVTAVTADMTSMTGMACMTDTGVTAVKAVTADTKDTADTAKKSAYSVPTAALPATGASSPGAIKGGALPDETRSTGKESTVTDMTVTADTAVAAVTAETAETAEKTACGAPTAATPATGVSTAEASTAGRPTAGAMKGGALRAEPREAGKESAVTGMAGTADMTSMTGMATMTGMASMTDTGVTAVKAVTADTKDTAVTGVTEVTEVTAATADTGTANSGPAKTLLSTATAPLRTFVPGQTVPSVPALLTTMPLARLIAAGESDELTFVTEGPCTVTVTAEMAGAKTSKSYRVTAGGLSVFRLDTRDFPSAETLTADAGACGKVVYSVIPVTAGACRLAWRSSAGSIEHYTFPIEKSVRIEAAKTQAYGPDGYVTAAVETERRRVLVSAYETREVLEALAEAVSSPDVWLVEEGAYIPVNVTTDTAVVHRHGAVNCLEIEIRSKRKTGTAWN